MDMFNLFDLFGGLDVQPVEEKKEVAKKEKVASEKKEAKPAAKKETKKKEDGFTISSDKFLVVARNFSLEVEGIKSSKELIDFLVKEGYEQIKIKGMELIYEETLNKVFINDNSVTSDAVDTVVDATCTILDGQIKYEFTVEEGSEDDVTVNNLKESWSEVNRNYAGCGMAYSTSVNLAYPVGSMVTPTTVIPENAKVLHEGIWEELEEGGAAKEVAERLHGTDLRKFSDEYYYVVYSVKGKSHKVGASTPTETKKKAEKKYPLPLRLLVVTFNMCYDLTPEHFGGKEKVTEKDIVEFMKTQCKLFTDSDRKPEFIYSDEFKMLSCAFTSGRKGYELPDRDDDDVEEVEEVVESNLTILRSEEEVEKLIREGKCGDYFFKGMFRGNPFCGYIKRTLIGTFLKEGGKVDYLPSIPKIPWSYLQGIIAHFSKDLTKEAAARIFYDARRDIFVTKIAKGNVSKVHIDYNYDMSPEDAFLYQVVDFHSHNTMEAFFSGTDNRDDVYPGIFGVIGKLDQPRCVVKMRIGMDGTFAEIPAEKVFGI